MCFLVISLVIIASSAHGVTVMLLVWSWALFLSAGLLGPVCGTPRASGSPLISFKAVCLRNVDVLSCPMIWVFSSIAVLSLLDDSSGPPVKTTKNVSKHCSVPPLGQQPFSLSPCFPPPSSVIAQRDAVKGSWGAPPGLFLV